ncbi:hypothetical protein ACMHYB_22575 [Sorangium sp. So ce1128]
MPVPKPPPPSPMPESASASAPSASPRTRPSIPPVAVNASAEPHGEAPAIGGTAALFAARSRPAMPKSRAVSIVSGSGTAVPCEGFPSAPSARSSRGVVDHRATPRNDEPTRLSSAGSDASPPRATGSTCIARCASQRMTAVDDPRASGSYVRHRVTTPAVEGSVSRMAGCFP